MSLQQFLLLASAHFLALLSPGADFFLLLNHSLAHGRQAGYRTAVGIALANAVFIVAALLGVRCVQEHDVAYWAMYWAGGAYLAYLAWQLWHAAPMYSAPAQAASGHTRYFVRGVCSGLLNPKNALFYLTLLTVLTGQTASAFVRGAAGVWMFLVVLVWDCCVCWLVTQPKIFTVFQARQMRLNRCCAGVLAAIVGAMLWSAVLR